MTHNQKIQTAIAAYLRTKSFPASLDDRIFIADSDEDKDGQCIVITNDMQKEFPQQSGNRYSQVGFELLTPLNEDTSLVVHQAAALALESALTADDLVSAINAAADDFTVIGILDRQPAESQEENFHSYGFTFRLYSAASDLS